MKWSGPVYVCSKPMLPGWEPVIRSDWTEYRMSPTLCQRMVLPHDHLSFHSTAGLVHSIMPLSGRATRPAVCGNTSVFTFPHILVRDSPDNQTLRPIWMEFSEEIIKRSISVISSGKHLLPCSWTWTAGEATKNIHTHWANRRRLSTGIISNWNQNFYLMRTALPAKRLTDCPWFALCFWKNKILIRWANKPSISLCMDLTSWLHLFIRIQNRIHSATMYVIIFTCLRVAGWIISPDRFTKEAAWLIISNVLSGSCLCLWSEAPLFPWTIQTTIRMRWIKTCGSTKCIRSVILLSPNTTMMGRVQIIWRENLLKHALCQPLPVIWQPSR